MMLALGATVLAKTVIDSEKALDRKTEIVQKFATEKAAVACAKLATEPGLCDGLLVTVSVNECFSGACWTSNATPRDTRSKLYISMLIEQDGDKLKVTHYSDSAHNTRFPAE